MRIIKRYSNRRLYDSETSRVITLKDIAELIKKGEEIKVVDNTTSEDITSKILGQTFLKLHDNPEEKNLDNFLLRALIKEKIDGTGSLVKKLVLAGIGITSLSREELESLFQQLASHGEKFQAKQVKNIKDVISKTTEDLEGIKTKFDELNLSIKGRIDEFVESIANPMRTLSSGSSDQLKDELLKKLEEITQSISRDSSVKVK